MLDAIRSTLHRAITTPAGDGLTAIRLPKDLARRLNVTLGSPLASRDELNKRRAAASRLAVLRATGERTTAARADAPVTVYYERDRNARELGRIEELLQARSIAYRKLDVAGDEATQTFVTREAKCELDQLPVVFVAATAVGTFQKLVAFDVSGELVRAVRGA